MSEHIIHIPEQFEPVGEAVARWVAGFPMLEVFQMSIAMAGMMMAEIQAGRETEIKFSDVDINIRHICELRMCGMVHSLPTPAGFQKVNGFITKNGKRELPHWYFALFHAEDRDQDVILCPTFGQLADSIGETRTFEKGERVQYLRTLITEDGGSDICIIDHPESPEFSFLLATRGAIERVFGLRYDFYHD